MMPIAIICPVCEMPLAWVPEEQATEEFRFQITDQHLYDCPGESFRLSSDEAAAMHAIAKKYLCDPS